MANTCLWSEDENGNWWTACDHGFNFADGGPIENGMTFCGYCGKPLRSAPYIDADVERERDRTQQREIDNRTDMELDERRAER